MADETIAASEESQVLARPEQHGSSPSAAAGAAAASPSASASLTTKSAPASTPAPNPAEEELGPDAYERTHVHSVYEAIAPHFSATRYKPWPVVADFLLAQSPGAVGLDVGCGNGKYLGVNPNVFIVGSDRSTALVGLARKHGQQDGHTQVSVDRPMPLSAAGTEVLVADGLALPFRLAAVDFVICVAVVHHMSTRQRRQEAVRHLLDCVKRPDASNPDGSGQVLVYVWALEQGTSRRGWDQGGDQDLLVPWVLKQQQAKKQPKKKKGDASQIEQTVEGLAGDDGGGSGGGLGQKPTDQTYQRYYHLYKKGELEEDVAAVGGRVISNGYDRDNWWVVAGHGP